MTLRSASIACLLLGLRAVTTDMTKAIAVVALATLHTVSRHVAYTTARVASLSAITTSTRVSTGSLGTRACDMADLSAAVAFGTRSLGARVVCCGIGAITADVTFLTALVTALGLLLHGAVSRDMTLHTTVVACRSSGFRARSCLVSDCNHDFMSLGVDSVWDRSRIGMDIEHRILRIMDLY